jgi:hypothetical protein
MRERHVLADGGLADFFLAEDAPLAVFACDGFVRALRVSTAQLNPTAQDSTARHGTAKSSTARHSTVNLEQ